MRHRSDADVAVGSLLLLGPVQTALDAEEWEAAIQEDMRLTLVALDEVDRLRREIERDYIALVNALEAAKDEFRLNGIPTNQGAVAQLERVQRTVRAHGDYMSFRDLRTFRQQLDRDVAEGGGYVGKTLKEATALRAKERLANEIRAALAAKAPELTPFNREFNFWKNVERTAAETALRQTGQQGGLLRVLGPLAVGGDVGIGAERGLGAAGAGGAAMGAVYGAARGMRSPLWRTASAVAKARVARLLAKGARRATLPSGEPARLLAGAARAPSELQGYWPARPRQ